jgi:hypothetical protein
VVCHNEHCRAHRNGGSCHAHQVLDGAIAVDVFAIGSSVYAIVAAMYDHGVQLIDVSDLTTPLPVGAATHDVNGFTALQHACGVDTFAIGGNMYAAVTSYINGVQLIDISNPASPVAIR